jgi:DNA-binding transcriptional MerR regulator
MSARTYLSIGDVLTLLREEFPDVTISKIRFLESQGLVNPERSPSGYRKFFEADVERLRWVLRQQREHFLPLKVIRDRLSGGDLGDEVPAEEPAGVESNGKHAHGTAVRTAGSATSPRTEEQMAKADDEAMARILADASRRAARVPAAGVERPPLRVVGDTAAEKERPALTPAAAAAPAVTAPTAAGPPAGQRETAPRASAAPTAAVTEPATPEAAPAVTPEPSGSRPSEPGRMKAAVPPPGAAGKPSSAGGPNRGAGPKAAASATQGMVSGASLTAEELCTASGLSEAELAGLQGFGLVEAEVVAGILVFNEDALTVANLAAEFRKFGIEPRHLRLYRNAVDRELSLIEQVIIPLLRQRNPESRQRAVEHADELGTLGQTMRATLLRAALRRHVGG